MDNTYKCMNCGNNLIEETDEYLHCHTCNADSGFIQITEENRDTLPFPTKLYQYSNLSGVDPNFCNDKEGICPCGVFIAHLINKKCDVIESAIAKEPQSPECHCKAAISGCGHSISHRLIDPCTGQL